MKAVPDNVFIKNFENIAFDKFMYLVNFAAKM